jgi:hypothetical protein
MSSKLDKLRSGGVFGAVRNESVNVTLWFIPNERDCYEMSSVGSITICNSVSRKRIDRRYKWDVLVDGKTVGDIALGEEKTFELDAGQHSVQVKRDPDLSSELLEVVLDQNRPI